MKKAIFFASLLGVCFLYGCGATTKVIPAQAVPTTPTTSTTIAPTTP